MIIRKVREICRPVVGSKFHCKGLGVDGTDSEDNDRAHITEDRIADRFRFNNLGSTMVKGMTAETRVYELVGMVEGESASHGT